MRVWILPTILWLSVCCCVAVASESPPEKNGQSYEVKPLLVPPSLKAQTPIEASGLAWIPGLQRFLLISDDTGFAKSGQRHRPWVFLMTPNGEVEAAPIELSGVRELNDLESIAPLGADHYFLLASQSINKKGKRDLTRTELYHVEREKQNWRVVAKASLFSAILRDLSPQERAALGLPAGVEPTLNIEASVFFNGSLLLGLKEPRPADGALLWSLKDPEGFLRSDKLAPAQLTLMARIDLGQNGMKGAAFSDLAQSPDGMLYALSTIPNAGKKAQQGGFHRLTRTPEGGWRVETLARFPGLKPEGLAFDGSGQAMIVFDEGDAAPLFTKITLSR